MLRVRGGRAVMLQPAATGSAAAPRVAALNLVPPFPPIVASFPHCGDRLMPSDTPIPSSGIQFEPHDKLPLLAAFGLGLQLMTLSASATILITTVVMRTAGVSETYLAWAAFAAVASGGAATMLQAIRLGRLGTGHVLMMGSSSIFITVCIGALDAGGPTMLVQLVVVAAVFQFVVSERLSLFRQILTPTVSGTVLMLIPISVMGPIFGLLDDVPEGSPALAAPVSTMVTVASICGLTLKATGALRLWAPIIGVAAGSLVAALFGIYDMARVAEASWIGFPEVAWPGLALDLGPTFWTLVPGFLLAAMIGSIRTISSAIAIQRVSWRQSKAIDFRLVQGAAATDGLSNLLAGLAGTVPNTAYSTGVSLAQITGVAARAVGVAAGALFLALAFLPKALDLVLAIPGPVFGAYLVIVMAMLFMIGVQMIIRDGLDYRKSVIVGLSFWIGLGFQSGMIFPEFFVDFAGGLLNNGMTAGGMAAILMVTFIRITEPRSSRLGMALDRSELPRLGAFLHNFAIKGGWNKAMARRLDAVGEEVLLTLLERTEEGREHERLRLVATARKEAGTAVLEFIAGSGSRKNLQDQVALLGGERELEQLEQEVSLRLVRHLSSSLRHQQYQGTEIVTVRVEPPKPDQGGLPT